MAVPFRSKRRGIEEKGVKNRPSFLRRINEKRIIIKCLNCGMSKLSHYVCRKCFLYKGINFSSFFKKDKKSDKKK